MKMLALIAAMTSDLVFAHVGAEGIIKERMNADDETPWKGLCRP